MKQRPKHIRVALDMAKAEGIAVTAINGGGNSHYKLTCEANGRSTTAIISASPSDHRAALNMKSFFRRFAKGQV